MKFLKFFFLFFIFSTVYSQTYITVPNKKTGNKLSATEFNQLIEALKNGTRSIKTEGLNIGGTYYTTFLIPEDTVDAVLYKLNGNALEFIFTKTITFSWVPTATDTFAVFHVVRACTIDSIKGIMRTGTEVVGGLFIADADGNNLSAVDSDITFTGGAGEISDDGTISNASLAKNEKLYWCTTSINAPNFLTVFIFYHYD